MKYSVTTADRDADEVVKADSFHEEGCFLVFFRGSKKVAGFNVREVKKVLKVD